MQSCRSIFVVLSALLTIGLGACADTTSNPDEAAPPETTEATRAVTTIREKLLYVAAVEMTEAGATASPDAVFTIDVKPGSATYGQIIHRTDMTAVGDELHHFGYDWDNRHLTVGGLFSQRVHVLDVHSNSKRPTVEEVNSNIAAQSGYAVPHTVIALPNGNSIVSMIGSANGLGAPGGMIEVDRDGDFKKYFGPGPNRDYNVVGPKYMYDVGFKPELNRMVTTTFGLPSDVAGGIDLTHPTLGLGNEVYVWDAFARRVIQRVDLGPATGALEVRWSNTFGEPVGYTNAPGTGAIWAWEDFDFDGVYQFHEVLTGLGIPTDMVITRDSKYLYVADWAGGQVFQINIQNRLHPVITATVQVPYAQMMRLSQDDKRLYVTNSLLSSWDDDADLGPARNVNYGIYLIHTNHKYGGMTLAGNPLVSFENVQKKNGRGRMRPHQVFFDPAVVFPFGYH